MLTESRMKGNQQQQRALEYHSRGNKKKLQKQLRVEELYLCLK